MNRSDMNFNLHGTLETIIEFEKFMRIQGYVI
jgi:hypothetical protein